MISHQISTRTISADPGLLTNKELLEKHGGRRRTLEELVAMDKLNKLSPPSPSVHLERVRKKVRRFLDHGRLKISVCDLVTSIINSHLSGPFSSTLTVRRFHDGCDDFRVVWG